MKRYVIFKSNARCDLEDKLLSFGSQNEIVDVQFSTHLDEYKNDIYFVLVTYDDPSVRLPIEKVPYAPF